MKNKNKYTHCLIDREGNRHPAYLENGMWKGNQFSMYEGDRFIVEVEVLIPTPETCKVRNW